MNKFLTTLMLTFTAITISTTAIAEPQPGQDFDLVTKQIPTDDPNKIEVMEVFWYGCIHCYQMETPLTPWIKKLPADVTFKHMPALPRADWAPMAKAYFAMESLGILSQYHGALFKAVHKQKVLNPTDEKAAIAWLTAASGLDKAKVEKAFNSFTVSTNLKRAAQIFRASGATGVPSLIIDGKYITSGTMAGGNAKALEVADYIIKNVRKAKAKAKKEPVKK
jgi:thiol:disulfide interchange protein DsbA